MDNNLKELCRAAHIKQVALATEIGVSQSVISDWQNGKTFPSTENLIQLSRILSVSTDCILGLAPIPEGYPDHVTPVPYNEVIRSVSVAAERPREFKPTKKPPFTQEQTAYLETWGQQLKRDVADEVVERLREDSYLLRETGDQGK